MEVVEFIKQKERMCDYHCGKACTHDDSGEICPAYNINCDTMTDQLEQLVEIVEQWAQEHPEETEQERQEPEHPKESSNLYANIDALEYRLDKLETTVKNESLILRELSKRNYNTHKELADRIAKLEKDNAESMCKPKRTNKDALLAAFPDAYVYPGGVPIACPLSLDKHYNCSKFKSCEDCGCAHWLAEVEE